MTAGRDPTEQVKRPREKMAPGASTSQWGRVFRLTMAALVAMMAIIVAGLFFAMTLFQPAGPAVASTPTPSASGSASQTIPPSASVPLRTTPVASTTPRPSATASATVAPTVAPSTPPPTASASR